MLLLTFSVGTSRFAVDAKRVVQVVPRVQLRPLPRLDDYLVGVLDLGGTILPVADLGLRLVGTACNHRLSTRIVVAQIQHEGRLVPLGFVAENITDLCEQSDDFDSARKTGGLDCLGPILRMGGELVQWIELDRILSDSTRALLYDVVLR